MTTNSILQVVFYFIVALALVKPLGAYMAQVYSGQISQIRKIGLLEIWFYRCCDIHPEQEMTWQQYTIACYY